MNEKIKNTKKTILEKVSVKDSETTGGVMGFQDEGPFGDYPGDWKKPIVQ